jgi:HK97 gp10 family phage protein
MLAKVKGIGDVVKAFNNMKELEVKDVLRSAAQGIINTARANCKNHYVKPQIDFITKNEDKYPNTVLLGIKGGNKNGSNTLTVPAMAVIEEFGTAVRVRKDGSTTGYVAARPFMRPAVDSNRERVTKIIKEGITDKIEKQAKTNNL